MPIHLEEGVHTGYNDGTTRTVNVLQEGQNNEGQARFLKNAECAFLSYIRDPTYAFLSDTVPYRTIPYHTRQKAVNNKTTPMITYHVPIGNRFV